MTSAKDFKNEMFQKVIANIGDQVEYLYASGYKENGQEYVELFAILKGDESGRMSLLRRLEFKGTQAAAYYINEWLGIEAELEWVDEELVNKCREASGELEELLETF